MGRTTTRARAAAGREGPSGGGISKRATRTKTTASTAPASDQSDVEAEGVVQDAGAAAKADASVSVAGAKREAAKLSNHAKKQLKKERKRRREAAEPAATPTTVFVGHLPFGFFEEQLRGFLSQFGDILRLRMSRSRSTGRSKGYGFVEFKYAEVAEIVAEALDGYLMYGRILKCSVMAEVHPQTFKGANGKYRLVPHRQIARERHNKDRTAVQHSRRVRRLVGKADKKRQRLEELGIAYRFAGYQGDSA